MKFLNAEAGSEDVDLTDFDVVWLAALVGAGQEDKEEIVVQVVRKMKKGSLLVLRGAWGLRSVLYCVRLLFSPPFCQFSYNMVTGAR